MIIITNRDITGEKDPLNFFGDKFNNGDPEELRVATITKDKNNKWIGEIFQDKENEMYASEKVFKDLQKRMKEKKRNCLFYVHGFNNSFKKIVLTCSNLEQTYNIEVVAFSWPSKRNALSYKEQKRYALQSANGLDKTLEKLNIYMNKYSKENECGQTFNLLLHSMGNYLFKHLLKSSIYNGETLLFDNIILASADANNKDHSNWVDKILFRRRLYITINENDYALFSSRLKFGEKQLARLGHFTRNLTSVNAIYLDFTDAQYIEKSHSYFIDTEPLKNHWAKNIFSLAFNGQRAEKNINYDPFLNCYSLSNMG